LFKSTHRPALAEWLKLLANSLCVSGFLK